MVICGLIAAASLGTRHFCLGRMEQTTDPVMTLKQLKYLLGIVDSGLNITAAAERLYTSQPGISKQLKQLEAELGMQIFTRKGKSLAAITPAGNEVIDRARKVLR